MKNLIVAFAIMISTLSFAQKGEREKVSPEQRVDKQVKEMTSNLNLSEKQQGEVKAILLEQSKKREAKRAEMKAARERGETPTDEQRAEMKKKMIDEQLEMKTKMKKILSEEQLKKLKKPVWKKGNKWVKEEEKKKNALKKRQTKNKF